MAYPTAASRDIAAPAEKVWALVSDLPRMGEWSPENAGGKWVKGATGPAVGAVFTGNNKNGFRRWTTNVTVIACEPGVVFEFAVTSGPLKVARGGTSSRRPRRAAASPSRGSISARGGSPLLPASWVTTVPSTPQRK